MRASPGSRLGSGGGILRLLPVAIRFLGIKGTLLLGAILLGYGLFSGNLSQMLGGRTLPSSDTKQSNQSISESTQEKELARFISVVLADTEDTWHTLFGKMGQQYREPKLVLYRQSVNSGCGFGSSQMGPFYCPLDQKVYIDLGFYDELRVQYRAPGDFAQAYVLAHEIGHHVQNLIGISKQVRDAQKGLDPVQSNRLSVRQELQADCLAGIWAHHAERSRQILESGDIQEGLAAASAIGDDTLQRQSRGSVAPDSFTHGTSLQRMNWFRIGFEKGSLKACDTFSADTL